MEKGRMETIYRLISKGRITAEEGAEEMSCTVEELEMMLREEGARYHID